MANSILASLKSEFWFMRGNLLTLIVSSMFMYFNISMTYFWESPYIRELGASTHIIGLMGSVGIIALCLFRILGAYVADKYGRKQIVVTMTFVMSLSYLPYVFGPDWRFILIGMTIYNFSLISQPALQALQADSTPPDKRGMGYAASHIMSNVPTIFAPLLVGFLVSTCGLVPGMRIVYTIVFFCCLAAAVIRLLFLRETLHVPQGIKLGEMKTVFQESLGAIAEAWRSMSKSLRFLILAFLIYSFEYPIFRMFHSLYIFDVVQISEMEWGVANTLQKATFLVIGLPLGKLIDRVGKKRIIILAHFSFVVSTFLLILSRNFVQLLLSHLTFPIPACLWTAYSALKADMIPRDKRGRILGTISTLTIITTIPASALGGLLYGVNPAYPFVFTIVLGVVASLVIFLAVKEPKTREI